MRIPLQLSLIFAICLLGEVLHRFLNIPVPGNILGMLVLLLLLCCKIIKPEQIKETTNFFLQHLAFFFLQHLAFFFLPASVSILLVYKSVQSKAIILFALCILTTWITLAVTGLLTQILIKKQKRNDS